MDRLIENQLKFINLRFGTFIHFNSATFQFNSSNDIVDWEFGHENCGENRKYPFCPKDWNPTELDCAQWARAAKSAGCRFAALTAKHHEGFCLWDTKHTEHCIRNATNKTDVVSEYLKAFRNEGIIAGIYFSILDLTHGIGRKNCTDEQKEFIKNQIRELLTNYGEIPFIIVDGWSAPWGGPSYKVLPFEELDSLVKSIQPNCLLMNIGASEGLNGTDVVFYENAAGQDIKEGVTPAFPAVSCNKLTDAWFWRKGDEKKPPKSTEWVIEKAERYFRKNINFMINISPNTSGKMDDNLFWAFVKIGEKIKLPSELQAPPAEWLQRHAPHA